LRYAPGDYDDGALDDAAPAAVLWHPDDGHMETI